jgi:hypothetical protein
MLLRLFPVSADNRYAGHWLALIILGAVTLLRGIIAFNSVVNTRMVVVGADGIPIDSWPAAAAAEVLSLFALLGHLQGLLVLIAMLILVRYRSFVPLMYAVYLLDMVGRQVLAQYQPGGPANLDDGVVWILRIMASLLIAGFALSLMNRNKRKEKDPAAA